LSWTLVAESVSVLLSPLIAAFVLRVRTMAPVDLPDPSMHTIYIVDPAEMFTRYMAALSATARLREGAQAGFLVVARLAYLAFGAVPGFFVTRYVFALIAIVPAYVLLRRLYGIPAGVLAVVALLSCPVVLTAWGTDYPDSAVVSYVVGAVACLVMPCRDRWRPAWLAAAGVLFTMGIWSHGMGVVLAATAIGVYLVVRFLRDRRHLLRDVVFLAGVAVSVTLLLMIGSLAVLGRFDFIRPTILAAIYLSKPPQVQAFHSSNPRWVLYVAYLLVPPAVVAAFWVTFARKLAAIPTPQLLVGLVCTAQFAVFGILQFFGDVETLEMHFFSSTLWGVVCLTLAVTLAEVSKPLLARPWGRWLPPALLVAVPLAYELAPRVPAFGWLFTGAVLAVVPLVLGAIMRLGNRLGGARSPTGVVRGFAMAVTIVGMAGSLLVLTVAPQPRHARLSGIALAGDPAPDYADALGGNASLLIDWYRVSTELPSFVGKPTYQGEQLLMWYSRRQLRTLNEPAGMFHDGFNTIPPPFAIFTPGDRAALARRRPAEVLFLSTTGAQFTTALRALLPYHPVLLRTTVLRQGPAMLHAWLIVLRSFARPGVT